ncbi:MAG: hypothetical protein JWO11_4423 [Nocardioides sp.]|nr:hypothetical protein [Nocardioides sp.]
MDDIERCAQLLGMRRREVLEVVPSADGDLVRTHDGQWTLIRDDGVRVDRVPAPTTLVDGDEATKEMLRGFHGDADPEDEPATKPAPKRQSRGRA